MLGSVTINFATNAVTSTGSGFKSHFIRGSSGNFTSSPHVLVAPTQISLSTYDDTFFQMFSSAGTSSLMISWQIDTAGKWSSQFIDFIVVGAMA